MFVAFEWRSVPGYVGLYEVSNHGDVRSIDRVVSHGLNGKRRAIPGRPLSQHQSREGHRLVTLCQRGEPRRWRVDWLVALAFVPNPAGKPRVRHLDGDPGNCRADNLAWASPGD